MIGETIDMLVIDTNENAPETGDASNLSLSVSIDDGAFEPVEGPAIEINSNSAPGLYRWTLSGEQRNGSKLLFCGISSTAGVVVIPREIRDTGAGFVVEGFSINARAQLISALAAAEDDGMLQIDVPCIPVVSGSDWKIEFTAIGDLSGRTNLIFAMKSKATDADAAALVLIDKDGLKVQNGSVAATPGNGAIVVTDQITGTGHILVKAPATLVPAGPKRTALKVIRASGDIRAAELWRPCVTVVDGIVDANV